MTEVIQCRPQIVEALQHLGSCGGVKVSRTPDERVKYTLVMLELLIVMGCAAVGLLGCHSKRAELPVSTPSTRTLLPLLVQMARLLNSSTVTPPPSMPAAHYLCQVARHQQVHSMLRLMAPWPIGVLVADPRR